jgi:hypothetical protein
MKQSRILLFPHVNICKLLENFAWALRYTRNFWTNCMFYGLLLQYKMYKLHSISLSNIHKRQYYIEVCGLQLQDRNNVNKEYLTILTFRTYKTVKLISGFHRASLLSVTFINQLMHSIITVVDVIIFLYKSLKDTH